MWGGWSTERKYYVAKTMQFRRENIHMPCGTLGMRVGARFYQIPCPLGYPAYVK